MAGLSRRELVEVPLLLRWEEVGAGNFLELTWPKLLAASIWKRKWYWISKSWGFVDFWKTPSNKKVFSHATLNNIYNTTLKRNLYTKSKRTKSHLMKNRRTSIQKWNGSSLVHHMRGLNVHTYKGITMNNRSNLK